jgi:hypothetical protein
MGSMLYPWWILWRSPNDFPMFRWILMAQGVVVILLVLDWWRHKT